MKSFLPFEKAQREMEYDGEVRLIFTSVEKALFDIYKSYFREELKSCTVEYLKKVSLRGMERFMREFDICPQLLPNKTAILLWNDINKSKTDNNYHLMSV